MNNILIIGAAGFIGRAVLTACAKVADLTGMDIAPPPKGLAGVEWITGSITDPALVASAASGRDAVIFLANASLPGSSQNDLSREAAAHVVATLQVAEICKQVGVKRFLFASSGGTVYGYDAPEGGGLEETGQTCPRNGYGVSKLAIEHYLRLMGQNGSMRTLSLRISNPYGEYQRAVRAQGVVAAAMQHAFTGTVMPVWGDGTVERDFIHISDVAAAFVAGLSHQGPSPVINIGSGKAVSINRIIDAVRRITGHPLQVEYQPGRSIDVRRNVLCITRAQEELDWAPRVELEDGLRRTAEWWLRG